MDGERTYKDLSVILAEKQKTIDKLTEENQSLLKIISHDIRAPFSQMYALLQIMELEEGESSENQKGYIERMYHSVLGGMEMIKNLHDSRTLDQGLVSVNMEEVELVPFLERTLRHFDIHSRLRSIKIQFNKGESSPSIQTDKYLLEKVINNLISNSIKFSEDNTTISIRYDIEKDAVVIIVEDEGPGIKEEDFSKVFNKFSKQGNKPTRGEATTGLGLFLSEKFIKLINGTIKVENIKNSGLRVKVLIPV